MYDYPKCRDCGNRLATQWEISAGRCDSCAKKASNPIAGMFGAIGGVVFWILVLFLVIWILNVYSR